MSEKSLEELSIPLREIAKYTQKTVEEIREIIEHHPEIFSVILSAIGGYIAGLSRGKQEGLKEGYIAGKEGIIRQR